MHRLLLPLAFLLAGCSSGSSGPAGEPRSLGGSYVGTISGSQAGEPFTNAPVTVTIQQAAPGAPFTGVWESPAGFGTLEGTTDGDVGNQTLTFTMTQTSPCAGSFTGTGFQGGVSSPQGEWNQISGSYSGAFCGGTVVVDHYVMENPPPGAS